MFEHDNGYSRVSVCVNREFKNMSMITVKIETSVWISIKLIDNKIKLG